MGLGEITKQLAKEVVGSQKKNIVDAVLPPDKKPEPKKPEVAPPVEQLGATIIGQIQAMQRALKDDQELQIHYPAGAETLRITEIFAPSWQLFILAGTDGHGNITRAITPVGAIHLICKVMRLDPEVKAVRVNIVAPKPPAPPA